MFTVQLKCWIKSNAKFDWYQGPRNLCPRLVSKSVHQIRNKNLIYSTIQLNVLGTWILHKWWFIKYRHLIAPTIWVIRTL